MALGLALTLCAGGASAQSATVTLTAQKQLIRGFGGISHAAWAGDLTPAERTLAFGNAAGQLGLSILRIPVTDGTPDAVNVATAKAALENGSIVFATPWNAAKTYTSADFASYATHLNQFVSYIKNQGLDLYAISVQNEPDDGASAGWGSWSADACHDFVLNYGAKITTKLMSCESFNYKKSYYDPLLNDPAALANLAILGTHIYGTAMSAYAYPLFDSKGGNKERWMTEHYTDSTTDANSWPNALGVASELHNAMVTGQFNAYVWWYIKRAYGFINGGAITKRGDCMAHWSRFVRPGFYRVDATPSPAPGLSLSAYKSESSVVVVIVNTGSSTSPLKLSIPGSPIATFAKYTTSSSKSLANDGSILASNGSLNVSLDASSVTTLFGTGSMGTAGAGSGGVGSGGASGVGVGGSSGLGGAGASGQAGIAGAADGIGGGGAGAFGIAGSAGASAGAGTASAGAGTAGASAGNDGNSALGGAAAAGGDSGGPDLSTGRSNEPPSCSCRVGLGGSRSTPGALVGLLSLLLIRATRLRRAVRVGSGPAPMSRRRCIHPIS